MNPQLLLDSTGSFLGWLGRASGQASVLIGLVLFVQWLFRHQLTPRWRHALWLLVVVRLALPWAPASRASLFNWFGPGASGWGAASATNSTDPAPRTLEESSAIPSASAVSAPGIAWRYWLAGLWLAGVGVLPGYLLVADYRLGRNIRRHRLLTNAAVLDLLEDCKQEMGIGTPLVLVETMPWPVLRSMVSSGRACSCRPVLHKNSPCRNCVTCSCTNWAMSSAGTSCLTG